MIGVGEVETQFFTQELKEWLCCNVGTENKQWALTFGVTVWTIWTWMNKSYIDVDFSWPVDPRFVIYGYMKANLAKSYECLSLPKTPKVEALVRWETLGDGWIKINSDSASRDNPGIASAAGVIMDSGGNWIYGFEQKLGWYCSVRAELGL
ncbi:Ribonuclease H [Quillaja saponaria]|uniref:Ribonuclease H n=1 Tax=Quillaja saponaria TaxID=32244 RepID=A0AAD7PNT9_QUISA|nr:Ribonuclease H [Quillaja saponaria]